MDKNEFITKADLKAVCTEIINELKGAIAVNANPDENWVRSNVVQRRLKISESTLRYWRDKRIIAHSRIDKIYFYSVEEIERLLEKNKITAISPE